jgi:hypothetical protein
LPQGPTALKLHHVVAAVVVSGDVLRRCAKDGALPSEVSAALTPSPSCGDTGVEEDQHYEVEKIVDERIPEELPPDRGARAGTCQYQFRVRFKGYGLGDDVWMARHELGDCEALLEAFQKSTRPPIWCGEAHPLLWGALEAGQIVDAFNPTATGVDDKLGEWEVVRIVLVAGGKNFSARCWDVHKKCRRIATGRTWLRDHVNIDGDVDMHSTGQEGSVPNGLDDLWDDSDTIGGVAVSFEQAMGVGDPRRCTRSSRKAS